MGKNDSLNKEQARIQVKFLLRQAINDLNSLDILIDKIRSDIDACTYKKAA